MLKLKHRSRNIPTDGRTYAEVEPDTDYFIHVRSHKKNKVILKFSVDGKDLGYKKQQHQGGVWRDWNRHGGMQSDQEALRFNKLYNRKNEVGDDEYEGHWTGSVELNVYEYVQLN